MTYESIALLDVAEEEILNTAPRDAASPRGKPNETFVLVAPFDGIGGARRALELLDLPPAVYISFEIDPECSKLVKERWPDVYQFGDLNGVSSKELKLVLDRHPQLRVGLVVGGAPCQPFSSLNKERKGWDDKRSDGIGLFVRLIAMLRELAPGIVWHGMLENVATMMPEDRKKITKAVSAVGLREPIRFDAKEIGHVRRDRLFWCTWEVAATGTLEWNRSGSVPSIVNKASAKPQLAQFLDPGWVKASDEIFPTCVRWIPRNEPPASPASFDDCDEKTLVKWKEFQYAQAPYLFRRELGVVNKEGEERPISITEREKLHGFKEDYTAGPSVASRISFIGNGYHCVVVAYLLASFAFLTKCSDSVPSVEILWKCL